MMKTAIRIFSLTLSGALFLTHLQGQNAIAISSDPGPGLRIALNWSPTINAAGYNIYRRNATDANYPATALNPQPIKPLINCFDIKSLLITTPDSVEWKTVASSLADSVLFDPCQISNLSTNSDKYNRLLMLTKFNMPIARVSGLGFEDNTVVNGNVYFYRIVALDATNNQIGTVANDLKVTAGTFTPFPAPTGIIGEPGDADALVRWNQVPGAAGYVLERSTNAVTGFQRVNKSRYSTQIKNHLNGDTLIPTSEGIWDFQRFDSASGRPIPHLVNGSWIDGPSNGTTYYYRVRSLDFFERAGGPSVVSNQVLPMDTTKPSVPIDLAATPDNNSGVVNIRWTQVVKDINGHWEQPDSSIRYRLYRFSSSDNPNTIPSVLFAETSALNGQRTKDTTDNDPGLRSQFGNRTWWYRIRSVDVRGNISQYSSAVSAIVKDITPPAIVTNLAATGFETFISVKWQLNTEPDMASYMVYRSLCHLGSWIECNPKDTCFEWSNYDPSNPNPKQPKEGTNYTYSNNGYTYYNKPDQGRENPRLPCPCSGPFVFLGEITQDSAKRAMAAGKFYFEDHTIPAGSPLCYAYWIKAKDSSDNTSGAFPIPSPAERAQILCQRLHDLTPPEPALISGLFAEADQIRVEWMGPPTQDTRAYHVYRAQGTNPANEPALTAYSWVGGMTIELPPALPKILTAPYKPPGLAPCDKISVQATPWMSQGFFEDKKIEPKLTYWYLVVGIDYDGNETPLSKAAPISTFSFTRKIPPAPVLDMISKQAVPCGVILQWSPIFNATEHLGFIIYRSNSAAGPFTPVVTAPVKGNSFVDTHVVQGNTYWYRIGLLLNSGRLSQLSPAQSITP